MWWNGRPKTLPSVRKQQMTLPPVLVYQHGNSNTSVPWNYKVNKWQKTRYLETRKQLRPLCAIVCFQGVLSYSYKWKQHSMLQELITYTTNRKLAFKHILYVVLGILSGSNKGSKMNAARFFFPICMSHWPLSQFSSYNEYTAGNIIMF